LTLADRLRAALDAGGRRAPELLAGDALDLVPADTPLKAAAVLVAVTDRPRPGVLLTRRTETLRRHAGQVAFPGGRADPEDADLIETALREAEEEIGLSRALVEVIGPADAYRTVTGYDVLPILAVVPADLPLAPHEAEVAALFEVPLAHLLEPANHHEKTIDWHGRQRTFFEIHWGGERIWGATAAMIVNLGRRLDWRA
jgi:8-oxo-dGTP pyrophosphatase MutT (NUDIX family)